MELPVQRSDTPAGKLAFPIKRYFYPVVQLLLKLIINQSNEIISNLKDIVQECGILGRSEGADSPDSYRDKLAVAVFC